MTPSIFSLNFTRFLSNVYSYQVPASSDLNHKSNNNNNNSNNNNNNNDDDDDDDDR